MKLLLDLKIGDVFMFVGYFKLYCYKGKAFSCGTVMHADICRYEDYDRCGVPHITRMIHQEVAVISREILVDKETPMKLSDLIVGDLFKFINSPGIYIYGGSLSDCEYFYKSFENNLEYVTATNSTVILVDKTQETQETSMKKQTIEINNLRFGRKFTLVPNSSNVYMLTDFIKSDEFYLIVNVDTGMTNFIKFTSVVFLVD